MQEIIIQTKQCRHCNTSFDITNLDLEFYEKISPVFAGKKYLIPSPSLCPDCRQQRRLSFRNERNLYRRNCDATGKQMISIYSPDKQNKVYESEVWWSDKWNALDYCIDFDFSKGFFEQFEVLLKNVPLLNLIGANNQNSNYINLTADSNNCYIVIESSNNENCYFGYWLQKCNNCCDVAFSHECEHCYEIQDCYNCYKLNFSKDCYDCRDSYLLDNCQSCKNCIGCVNLVNKQYCILNKQYTKEKYLELHEKLKDNFDKTYDGIKQDFDKLKKNAVKKYAQVKQIENSTGDYLKNTKNCIYCFHSYDAQDCKYGEHVFRNAKDVMDASTVGRDANLVYETINTGINVSNDLFCMVCWSSTFMLYCFHCFSCNHCFGCVGLRNKEYCILNKQYTKEEYEKLVPRIIEHMQKTGDYGEFFPSEISPFGYNETVAQEYFPISPHPSPTQNSPHPNPLPRGEGIDQPVASSLPLGETEGGLVGEGETEGGLRLKWSTYEAPKPNVEKIVKAIMLPKNIKDIQDDILAWAIECEETGKPFRIIKQELEFYRKHSLPIPKKHPDQRHLDRMKQRNPKKLYNRKCDKCGVDIKTTFSPDRKEKVYCEKCYEKEIY